MKEFLALPIPVIIVTGLHIVFGELAPKTIALQKSESTALWVAAPMAIFTRVFGPFIWALNGLGRLAVRTIGIKPIDDAENSIMEPEELERVIVDRTDHEGTENRISCDTNVN